MLPVLMPLPSNDFDPTEAAITWKIVTDAGFQVAFATPDGKVAHADPVMLTGEGLDPWGFVPFLKKIRLVGLTLRANADARTAYAAMFTDKNYQQPLTYLAINVGDYSGLVLPGGHCAKGMCAYLESEPLQKTVAEFFDENKPVGAICHGVLLAARSVSPKTGRSVLYGRKATSLTWDFERKAWNLSRYFVRFWDPDYYRTYTDQPGQPVGYMSVQAEISRLLASPDDFLDVPKNAPNHILKSSGLVRDSIGDDRAAWVVKDGNFVSARWPGDAHTFGKAVVDLLKRQ